MSEEFREPFQQSYQIGVLLAANAIRDAYLVVDGPNCTMFRASHLQGNHDWSSDLLRSDGFHRVADTDATTERLALGDDRLLRERLRQIIARPDCGLVLLSAMSPAAMTGRQYDRQVRELGATADRPVVFVPNGSLTSDWLSGYAAVLQSLAEGLPLPAGPGLREDRIAIVGHLMHRNEADLLADVAELRRLLAGLGLELGSCWLDGGGVAGLEQAASAGTLVSLPYGRAAASTLAARTGARLVECNIPLGLEGCRQFLSRVAEATGRQQALVPLLEVELGTAARRLQWMLPHSLLGRRVALIGDPHLVAALSRTLDELGCQVVLNVFWAQTQASEPQERDLRGRVVLDPSPRELGEAMNEELEGQGLDLVIANGHALWTVAATLVRHEVPFLELGFPSYHTHALVEAASLGFQGTLHLAERMANAISHQAIRRACRPEPG